MRKVYCGAGIQCKPRLLKRAQIRWGFQRGEAAALPFDRIRGFKYRVRYNLIVPIYRPAKVDRVKVLLDILAEAISIANAQAARQRHDFRFGR